jgi:hypothetical protein
MLNFLCQSRGAVQTIRPLPLAGLEFGFDTGYRKDLNNPPIAVGGISTGGRANGLVPAVRQ